MILTVAKPPKLRLVEPASAPEMEAPALGADARQGEGELEARSDDELMRLAAAGSRAALGVLAARHMVRLVTFCARFTGDRDAAEELAQDVWLEIWRRRHAYRAEGRFGAFLFAAARNRCKNHQRRGWRKLRWLGVKEESRGLDELATERHDDLDRLLAEERRGRVHRALARLDEKQREALLLRFGESLDYEDIAAVVGAPAVTVRSRVFHGIRRLRRALGEEDE